MKYSMDDVRTAIENGDVYDAEELLVREIPGIKRKFNAVCKSIISLMTEINAKFPDAQYYTASGGFHILLGPSHGDSDGRGEEANRDMSTLGSIEVSIGDGDW